MDLLDWLMGEKFAVGLYCKNCGHETNYYFPVGTRVNRAPYLGYEDSETTVRLPNGEYKAVKCKVCKTGNVA